MCGNMAIFELYNVLNWIVHSKGLIDLKKNLIIKPSSDFHNVHSKSPNIAAKTVKVIIYKPTVKRPPFIGKLILLLKNNSIVL